MAARKIVRLSVLGPFCVDEEVKKPNKQTKHYRVAGIIYMKLVDIFTLLIFILDERIKNISLVRSFISVFVFLFV